MVLMEKGISEMSAITTFSEGTERENSFPSQEVWMKANVNAFLQIKDKKQADEFLKFHTANNTYVPFLSIFLFTIFFVVPYMLAFIVNEVAIVSLHKFCPLNLSWRVLFSCLLFCLLLFWVSYYVMFTVPKKPNRFLTSLRKHSTFIRSICYFGITACFCAHFIIRILGGPCQSNYNTWVCNPNHATNGLPPDSVFIVILGPRMLSLVMREVPRTVQGICYALSVGTLFFCAFYTSIQQHFLLLTVYILAMTFIIYDSQCHKLTLFYLYQKVRTNLEENERNADERHANEMRAMIGNVAHDLKTPLTSFLSGVEFIIQAVTELKSKIVHEQRLSMDEIVDTIHVISTCTKNMTSTNCFMLMAINRCIDYTKASKGLKLNPKYETIDLLDTLALPLNTMASVQGDIEIRLNPIPKHVCSHIITDKQWLQENVLCLLSNAVKYSSEGLVTITVTLGSRPKTNRNGILSKVKTMVVSRRKVYAAPDEDGGNEYDESIDQLLRGVTATTSTIEQSPVPQGNMPGIQREKTPFEKLQHDAPSLEINDRLAKTAKAYQDHNQDDLIEKNALLTPRSEKNQQQINNSGSTVNDDSKLEKKKLKKPDGNSNEISPKQFTVSNLDMILRFEIEDTGIGISEEVMPHLFSPFKQAQRYSGGTGLGLYSLAKRIEALKGNCGVTARRDGQQGSLFWFEIPYKPDRFTSNISKTKETNIYTNSSDISPMNDPNRMNWFKTTTTAAAPPTLSNPNNIPSRGNSSKSPHPTSINTNESHRTLDMNEESDPHHSPVRTPVNASPKNWSPMPSSNHNIIEVSSMSPSHIQKITYSPSFKLKVPKAQLNILIVDDAASILKMTSMILKRGGHQITTACNGADALNKIIHGVHKEKDPVYFDIIIMDLQMPVMDGLEATRRIRKLELTGDPNDSSKKKPQDQLSLLPANIPIHPESDSGKQPSLYRKHIIIGCSANSDDETIEESYKAGVDSFMAKPFSIDTFYEIYDSIINPAEIIHDLSSESVVVDSAKVVDADVSKMSVTSVKSRSNSNPPSPIPHSKHHHIHGTVSPTTNNPNENGPLDAKIKLQKQLTRQITHSRYLLAEMNDCSNL